MKKLRGMVLIIILAALLSSFVIHPLAKREVSGASAAPAQSPQPSPSPAPSAQELAWARLSEMSLEEKVWQLLYVFPQDVTGDSLSAEAELWRESLQKRPVGGIVINSENMESARQLQDMLAAIKAGADIVPFTGVDEEGGQVARLAYTLGVTTDFKPMYTYKDEGPETAFANARTIAMDIASFGFNQDFAPVADVWTNSKNTVIGKRAYSDRPEEAAELVAAAVQGFQSGGVLCTLKHFPGHGDTAEDSHYSSAYSDRTLEQLRQAELLPFIAGIKAGADMVMTGHITMTAIDPEVPATLSETVVTGLLREELGWEGVVITDSFKMAAVTEYGQEEAAVMAINAGCDMILGPGDPEAVVRAIMENVSPQRIDESVLRILTLKQEKLMDG